jgi:NAD(P)-dependent dehydrogenase (short-subunit alcohol dehydrogenase family)
VFCARGAKDGKALARKTGATFLDCDVSKVGEVRSLVDETVRLHGRLDCLVNNAGTHPGHRPIDGFSEEDFRELLELNVVSMFAACRRALPHLRKTKGNIINVSSLVARMGQLHAATYVATKGAVTALTKALAVDEAAHDVRVNSVSPGNVWTPLWARAVEASEDPRKCRADGEAAQLLGRMGTIEEAGRLCLFIAAEATFTTGVDHVLSGGAELAYGRKTRKER